MLGFENLMICMHELKARSLKPANLFEYRHLARVHSTYASVSVSAPRHSSSRETTPGTPQSTGSRAWAGRSAAVRREASAARRHARSEETAAVRGAERAFAGRAGENRKPIEARRTAGRAAAARARSQSTLAHSRHSSRARSKCARSIDRYHLANPRGNGGE